MGVRLLCSQWHPPQLDAVMPPSPLCLPVPAQHTFGNTGRREEKEAGEKEARVEIVRRARSKPANHEAESAYVNSEGGAAGNVMKFSEICQPATVL